MSSTPKGGKDKKGAKTGGKKGQTGGSEKSKKARLTYPPHVDHGHTRSGHPHQGALPPHNASMPAQPMAHTDTTRLAHHHARPSFLVSAFRGPGLRGSEGANCILLPPPAREGKGAQPFIEGCSFNHGERSMWVHNQKRWDPWESNLARQPNTQALLCPHGKSTARTSAATASGPWGPYKVRPAFFNENATFNAVTVFLRGAPCTSRHP